MKLKKKTNEDVEFKDELAAIESCMAIIAGLHNYNAEGRVIKYLMERHKGDYKRKYED